MQKYTASFSDEAVFFRAVRLTFSTQHIEYRARGYDGHVCLQEILVQHIFAVHNRPAAAGINADGAAGVEAHILKFAPNLLNYQKSSPIFCGTSGIFRNFAVV